MTFEGEREQSIDERRVVHAACGPQLREHADRGEAGECVDLVHEERAARSTQEEVDARESCTVDGLKRGNRQPLNLADGTVWQFRWNRQRGMPVEVLRLVVV